MDLIEIDSKTPVQLQRREAAFPDKFVAVISSGIREKMNLFWKLLSTNLLFCGWEHFCYLYMKRGADLESN